MKRINIAIDGPASSGKSTVAKIIAADLGYVYTDTGAMYRSVTYAAIKHQVAFDDPVSLVELIHQYPISFQQTEKGQKVFLANEEVTEKIRQPEVTNNVSEVSAFPQVRKELVRMQQEIAAAGGVVMDGRDIGTAVLPAAAVKIFLVASVSERAQRRFKENQTKGIITDLATLQHEIEQRDYRDSHRSSSPLKQALDAVKVDTTGMTISEVVARIKQIIREKMSETSTGEK